MKQGKNGPLKFRRLSLVGVRLWRGGYLERWGGFRGLLLLPCTTCTPLPAQGRRVFGEMAWGQQVSQEEGHSRLCHLLAVSWTSLSNWGS